jgi:hypothetical protein
MNSQSKARRIAAWILTSLLTLLFVASSVMKLLVAPGGRGVLKSGA